MGSRARSASPKLIPLPSKSAGDMQDLLFVPADELTPLPPSPPPVPADELIRSIAAPSLAPIPDVPALDPQQQAEAIDAVLAEIAADDISQPQAALYQDFQVRCRMSGVPAALDLAAFSRRLALALAGMKDGEEWTDLFSIAASLPDEMLAPFLLLARAAREGIDCPGDAELARLYRTASAGRARRMLEFIEQKGLIVCREDLSGRRVVSFPHFGWVTAAALPDPARPPRMARIMARKRRSSAN